MTHPTRRHFLQNSLVAIAAASLVRGAVPAGHAKDRPFGFSLYGMKSLPVLDALDHCKRIGYRSVELCLMKDFPTELGKFSVSAQRDVRDRLKSTGLNLSGLLVQLDIVAPNQTPSLELLKRAGEVAIQLENLGPPLVETVTGGKAENWEAMKDRAAENLRGWAETAGAAGVKVAIKAHYGHIVNSPDRLLWLYRQVNHPALTLTYDYSHYQAEGFELEPTLRALIPHTGFISVKDIVVGEKPLKYLLVGEGKIDYVKYFRLLRELNYSGPVVVEVSALIHRLPGYEPIPTAEKCYAFLERTYRASTQS